MYIQYKPHVVLGAEINRANSTSKELTEVEDGRTRKTNKPYGVTKATLAIRIRHRRAATPMRDT